MNRQQGATLIELVAYVAIFGVILTLAFSAYYQADVTSRGLSRHAADIVKAVQVGESWRREVRGCIEPSRLATVDGVDTLELPLSGGVVRYFFREGKLWRQETNQTHASVLPLDVSRSRFISDHRGKVDGWRWELELRSRRTNAAIKPLFTFLAPQTISAPR